MRDIFFPFFLLKPLPLVVSTTQLRAPSPASIVQKKWAGGSQTAMNWCPLVMPRYWFGKHHAQPQGPIDPVVLVSSGAGRARRERDSFALLLSGTEAEVVSGQGLGRMPSLCRVRLPFCGAGGATAGGNPSVRFGMEFSRKSGR